MASVVASVDPRHSKPTSKVLKGLLRRLLLLILLPPRRELLLPLPLSSIIIGPVGGCGYDGEYKNDYESEGKQVSVQ